MNDACHRTITRYRLVSSRRPSLVPTGRRPSVLQCPCAGTSRRASAPCSCRTAHVGPRQSERPVWPAGRECEKPHGRTIVLERRGLNACSDATISRLPISAALCMGVRLSLSVAAGSAPESSSASTMPRCPSEHARCSGVQPSLSTWILSFGSTPSSNRSCFTFVSSPRPIARFSVSRVPLASCPPPAAPPPVDPPNLTSGCPRLQWFAIPPQHSPAQPNQSSTRTHDPPSVL
jgi:hypothetical protein